MPEKLTLSALDVAGAPAQTAKLCKPGDIVLIIGAGGKSGMLCCYEAKKRVGITGKVIGMTHSPKSTERLQKLGFCDHVFAGNATNPVETMEKFGAFTNGEMADVTINCVNIESTEMTSILCTKDTGLVYFFSMATSFTRAALGAEGVGSDVTMIVGNGYTRGHAEITLELLRESEKLRNIFTELYA
jgi:L-erythro-3,5-diaminohexanoate dehydrogenase